MTFHKGYFRSCVVAAVVMTLLAGCNISTPSRVKTGEIRLRDDIKTVQLNLAAPGPLDRIAEDYRRNGDGGMRLVVAYPEKSPMREQEIRRDARALQHALSKAADADVAADYVPVPVGAASGHAVLSYRAAMALPPEDCGRMTGYKGADTRDEGEKYSIGCETKTTLSRMVVNKKDLMGRDGTADGFSRRQGAAVENYMAGTPNEPLEGTGASEIGGE